MELVFWYAASGLCVFQLIMVQFLPLYVLFGFKIQNHLSTLCLKTFLRYSKFPVVMLQPLFPFFLADTRFHTLSCVTLLHFKSDISFISAEPMLCTVCASPSDTLFIG